MEAEKRDPGNEVGTDTELGCVATVTVSTPCSMRTTPKSISPSTILNTLLTQ